MIFGSILYEAPEDEGDVGEDTVDKTKEDSNKTEEPKVGDETEESSAGDDSSEEDAGDEDFDMPDGMEDGENLDGDSGAEDAGDDSYSEGNESNELKQKENEIFNDLNEDQMVIRDQKLISLYIELYDRVEGIISKSDKFDKNEKTIDVVDFAVTKLFEVKDILYDYITKTYKTKTYIQNMTTYYEFIATINGIIKVLDKIGAKHSK